MMADWLPPGKRAAVCFSIDDVHPAKASDCYDAGGDLGAGALGHLEWLLERHPQLCVTLFVTADWREISPHVTRPALAAMPYLRDHVFLAKHWRKGTMQLDRHPEFVRYLKNLPRTELALHGLEHLAKGLNIAVEFEHLDFSECAARLERAIQIFHAADLPFVSGLCPPGWTASQALLDAMAAVGLDFIASARDIVTPITPTAQTNMSGLRGTWLLQPQTIHAGQLIHIPTNWQATSTQERALQILQCGGLLSIKAHIVKNAQGHISYDGLDKAYRDILDELFIKLEQTFGSALWWTSMGEINAQFRKHTVSSST